MRDQQHENDRPDPRISEHDDLGVQVSRDLTGSGRILRGTKTGGHTLKFRSTGHRTGGRDPHFVARDGGAPPEPDSDERTVERREAGTRDEQESLLDRLKFWK